MYALHATGQETTCVRALWAPAWRALLSLSSRWKQKLKLCLPARLVMILLWICYAIATSPSFFMFSANVSVNHPGAKENKLPWWYTRSHTAFPLNSIAWLFENCASRFWRLEGATPKRISIGFDVEGVEYKFTMDMQSNAKNIHIKSVLPWFCGHVGNALWETHLR